jgi:hypothetical protein
MSVCSVITTWQMLPGLERLHWKESAGVICYCYMVQGLPEHPVGSQRGSWGTFV